MSMNRNKNFFALAASYLFPEVAKRRRDYQATHPDVNVISLGVGNTTEPLPESIARKMADFSIGLSTAEGYSGYGADYGDMDLRDLVAKTFYNKTALKGAEAIAGDEIFISDGAKCDIARLQTLFGGDVNVAVQDPSYPVYVDGSIIAGAGERIQYLPSTAENRFFPDPKAIKPNSLIYICSPNNPTGATATKEQLSNLVDHANKNKSIIIFDAAYSGFIRDESLPKSIFEIPGARTCAIEVQSLSKPAGFTGVRLGWSVVPKDLTYSTGESVNKDWARVQTTLFNCASNIAQRGGVAALTDEGLAAMKSIIDYYLYNGEMIKKALSGNNWKDLIDKIFYTGNSPYLWVHFRTLKSWDAFDLLLNRYNIVTTPGRGFGPCGEGYLRFSSFGHRADIEQACERLSKE